MWSTWFARFVQRCPSVTAVHRQPSRSRTRRRMVGQLGGRVERRVELAQAGPWDGRRGSGIGCYPLLCLDLVGPWGGVDPARGGARRTPHCGGGFGGGQSAGVTGGRHAFYVWEGSTGRTRRGIYRRWWSDRTRSSRTSSRVTPPRPGRGRAVSVSVLGVGVRGVRRGWRRRGTRTGGRRGSGGCRLGCWCRGRRGVRRGSRRGGIARWGLGCGGWLGRVGRGCWLRG